MLFGWLRSVPKVPPKRLAELEQEIADAQRAIAWLRKSLLDLNGRMSTLQRQHRPEPAPDIEPETPQYHEDLSAPPRHPVPRPAESTEHLARRFRGV